MTETIKESLDRINTMLKIHENEDVINFEPPVDFSIDDLSFDDGDFDDIADMVNHPPHYTAGNIETWDYMVDVIGEYAMIDVCRAQVFKYTGHRMFNKGNPIEDAEKARWYLDRMIEFLKKTKGHNW